MRMISEAVGKQVASPNGTVRPPFSYRPELGPGKRECPGPVLQALSKTASSNTCNGLQQSIQPDLRTTAGTTLLFGSLLAHLTWELQVPGETLQQRSL